MRAVPRVLDLATRIAPFGDLVGEIALFGRSLAALREEEVASSGVDPRRLHFADHAFATAPLLRAFAACADGRPRALALPANAPAAALAPVSSVRFVDGLRVYDVFLDADPSTDLDGRAHLEGLRRIATPTRIDGPFRARRRELPRLGPPPHHLELPEDGRVAAHVEHWVHLLWLGPALLPRLLERAQASRRPGMRRGTRGLAASFIDPDADVHPSAHVEGSIIEAGAVVGARASVRHSYLGAGTHLADFTKLTHTVLGPGSHTLADAHFSHVVALGPGTLSSFGLRDTLLGAHVFLTSGVIFWCEALGETIAVEHDGRWIDTGRKVLGGCAGHGAVLGARTIVAPGRAIPNRVTVVMRREEGVLRVAPAEPGTPMCWSKAALVPRASVFPERDADAPVTASGAALEATSAGDGADAEPLRAPLLPPASRDRRAGASRI